MVFSRSSPKPESSLKSEFNCVTLESESYKSLTQIVDKRVKNFLQIYMDGYVL